ncbi:MAG: Na+/H+ antiporter NhaA [Rhodopirellula sp.]|nr:Na+/H+ antiporter NhaA [Rhodopirellula sp.]
MSHKKQRPAAIDFLFENSLFLIAGAIGALVWANTAPESYHDFVHLDLMGGDSHHAAPAHDDGGHGAVTHPATSGHEPGTAAETAGSTEVVSETDSPGKTVATNEIGEDAPTEEQHGFTLHFLINDILMALFFAIAGKEVWEAMLPGGALSDPKKAATPLLATVGGVFGPAVIYMAGVMLSGQQQLTNGWAIPCATDIAFSYLVARMIFGNGHPAIAFLLLLAIADDAAGLVILAVFYPMKPLALEWMGLALAGMAVGFGFQKLKLQSFWWYLLIPGVASWFAFYKAGIHPALGLIPIIPIMPHAKSDLGIFAREELDRHDTLNEFEHWWKNKVELILGLFGLVNAGVALTAVGTGTWLVLSGLIVGKPVGIFFMTWFACRVLGLKMPEGMNYRHVITLGMVAAIGFTVALFVSTAAFPLTKFPTGIELDSVKMGALGSFGAAGLSFLVARLVGVKSVNSNGDDSDKEPIANAA